MDFTIIGQAAWDIQNKGYYQIMGTVGNKFALQTFIGDKRNIIHRDRSEFKLKGEGGYGDG